MQYIYIPSLVLLADEINRELLIASRCGTSSTIHTVIDRAYRSQYRDLDTDVFITKSLIRHATVTMCRDEIMRRGVEMYVLLLDLPTSVPETQQLSRHQPYTGPDNLSAVFEKNGLSAKIRWLNDGLLSSIMPELWYSLMHVDMAYIEENRHALRRTILYDELSHAAGRLDHHRSTQIAIALRSEVGQYDAHEELSMRVPCVWKMTVLRLSQSTTADDVLALDIRLACTIQGLVDSGMSRVFDHISPVCLVADWYDGSSTVLPRSVETVLDAGVLHLSPKILDGYFESRKIRGGRQCVEMWLASSMFSPRH